MKSRILRWAIATVTLTTPLHAEFRTWTSTEGSKIQAEFVKVENESVTLKLLNGSISTFPESKLSQADQEFIKSSQTTVAAPSASTEKEKPTVPENRKAKWLTRMDKAKQESEETGLPIFVLFTGTTWCPYCIKLEKAVFSEKEFKSYANQHLVLLMLDFGPGGTPNNRRDEKLAKEFGVKGFPTYFLTNSEGKQLASGGYHDGITPSEFAKWVDSNASKS
ncbi:thioredoxin family protein [Luteolibacter pohnpeiensis]|uniref:Thioredoxin family protein n=1 Tax=Luteolibacter pohnpeiensis TaxID=454153 RepID=A0A934S859_9BACT|nr:thioredoxin fold domain-containing protein [Luteolibacter pohnpeiensis]MBK1882586.1 thioredoxin family protein [Luteolibacter pohnpeiensis]